MFNPSGALSLLKSMGDFLLTLTDWGSGQRRRGDLSRLHLVLCVNSMGGTLELSDARVREKVLGNSDAFGFALPWQCQLSWESTIAISALISALCLNLTLSLAQFPLEGASWSSAVSTAMQLLGTGGYIQRMPSAFHAPAHPSLYKGKT